MTGDLLLLLGLALSATCSAENDLTHSKEWDVLIFTQHWPATVCYEWKDKNPDHSCTFPSQKNAWSVHGIWPTKFGTMGPSFCNNTWKFDSTQIQPIESQMEQYWTNIEKDTPLYSLWEHEWMKHGTCAAQQSVLDDEMKYFAQGIRWLQLYSMTDILSKSGIYPNDTTTYDVMTLYNAVRDRLKKNPALHCAVSPHTGLSYVFEIRICFDKSLELVDCDGVLAGDGISYEKNKLIHCDLTKPIHYIDRVPYTEKGFSFQLPLIEIYKLLNWLRWFTL